MVTSISTPSTPRLTGPYAAEFLLAVPAVLRARANAVAATARTAATADRLPGSVAPDRLMLAHYPGDGARYVVGLVCGG